MNRIAIDNKIGTDFGNAPLSRTYIFPRSRHFIIPSGYIDVPSQ